jgi:hypothetical protein
MPVERSKDDYYLPATPYARIPAKIQSLPCESNEIRDHPGALPYFTRELHTIKIFNGC